MGPATSSLKWLNVEPRRLKGNPSFSRDIEALGSISGLKVSYLGTQHSLAWVLSLKIKLSVIPSPLTELSFGMESTDFTEAKAEPQQIQDPKVTGKGLTQFQPSDGKPETEGCPNDVSHPRDRGRLRARATE